MFVGHYGPSFAIRAVRPEVPLWVLFVAVQLVDVAFAAVAAWIDRQRVPDRFEDASAAGDL